VSARKSDVSTILGLCCLAIILVALLAGIQRQRGSSGAVTLQSNGHQYVLKVAARPAQQHLGLGRIQSLPSSQGMFFIFERPAVQCFWMKDMHFPLDMIWVSSTHRVEHVQTDVRPSTYPHTFCPNVQAEYVIELNAGQAVRASIHTGETLHF
jgi:uncharacterized membrane protein (UPF0127 family)